MYYVYLLEYADVVYLYILIDYIGHDEGEPKRLKDFKRRIHLIEITPKMTENGYASIYMPVDIIDDDIVEQRSEYYSLVITNTTLPQRVKIGRFYSTTKVVIKDDDGKSSLYNCIAGKFGKFGESSMIHLAKPSKLVASYN